MEFERNKMGRSFNYAALFVFVTSTVIFTLIKFETTQRDEIVPLLGTIKPRMLQLITTTGT
jgi:hypothetical protein